MKKIIAIDGPAGAGKSTIAKEVARILGFQYLDTGALYRAVAYYFYKKQDILDQILKELKESEELIKKELKNIQLSYRDGRIYLLHEDVSDFIREPQIGELTSILSAKKVIRDFLVPIQRSFAMQADIVAEGRDMTTVVFPDAWKKFYLDASLQTRAKRRYEQLKNAGKSIRYEQALKDVLERDERDSNRENAPLKIASDAIYIDTSELYISEVVSLILKKVAEDD